MSTETASPGRCVWEAYPSPNVVPCPLPEPAFIYGISLLRGSVRTWDGKSIGSLSVGPTNKVLRSSGRLLFGVSWLTHRDPGCQEFATSAVTGYSGRRRLQIRGAIHEIAGIESADTRR